MSLLSLKLLRKVVAWTSLCFAAVAVHAQSPTIFFADITSGPASGGEGGGGAYVTVYGNFFGTTPGTVTVGGVNATTYKLWGSTWLWYQKLTFQVPAGTAMGTTTIQVTTAAGKSNTVPFTVRAGNIYCVSTAGNDNNNGKFPASCWQTITKANSSMVPGDISYIENGVTQSSIDNYGATLAIRAGGTVASPVAILAYPGATVTIGSVTAQYGVRTPAIAGSKDFFVLAGLRLLGQDALDLVGNDGWRVIGNDLSCPKGSGQSACLHTDTNTNLLVYGNRVHNVGDQAGSIDKYFHAVYFTTDTNHVWMGWNEVAPNPQGSTTSGGCRAIQFYSTGGSDQYDLHVFSNLVHDAICDGINFATVDPTKGTVEAYNNVVYHVGTGPDPYNGGSNYSCVLANSSGVPAVPVKLYNNTLYDCGRMKTSDSGGIAPYTTVQAIDNITYLITGETYINPGAPSSGINGSNNIWFGVTGPPSTTSGNIVTDPLFVSQGSYNFALQTKSPAIGAGIDTGLATDMIGLPRPTGAQTIGARAVSGPAPPPTSPCDLNGDGLVNALDVTSAVDQALGTAACTNADLVGTGTCTVVDVQRVVNAKDGQVCRVGK
jgi:hypothetical protein